jgi:hypothetical protein
MQLHQHELQSRADALTGQCSHLLAVCWRRMSSLVSASTNLTLAIITLLRRHIATMTKQHRVAHRRVGTKAGRRLCRATRSCKPTRSSIPGFQHTYVWGAHEADPAEVDASLPRSALPPADGSLLQIVTFPPAASRSSTAGQKAIDEEYRPRLPELAESFERNGSGMHATQSIDYALVLDGELWLGLDDGRPCISTPATS